MDKYGVEKYDGFERIYSTKIKNAGAEKILIEASMLDFDHAIWTEIEINAETREIIRAEAKMPKVPHAPICQKATEKLKEIVGLKIEHGLSRKLREVIGKNDGCVHIYKLIWLSADAAANYLGRFATPEEQREFLKNTCVVYKEEIKNPASNGGKK